MGGPLRIRHVVIAIAMCAAATGCGSSDSITPPTAPPQVNALALGSTWTVHLSLDSCVSNQSECPTHESASLIELTVRTATVGQEFTAVVQSQVSWITRLPVVLTGQLQPDGGVRYQGRYQSEPTGDEFRDLDVQELTLKPDDRLGLTGSLLLVDSVQFTFTNLSRLFTKTIRATVRSASRQAFADTSRVFQGAFDGFGTVRACDGTCPSHAIGDRVTLSLRMTQSGSVVAGEFGNIPVTGTVNGTAVVLSGEVTNALDRFGVGTTLSRLESFAGTIDALGRLTGTLRLYNEGIYDSQPGAGTQHGPFTERLTIDLTTVIRQ